ncbi:hypothetical protein [Pseudomonas sp. Pseu.R1]|uniref:hypothetical protein n=1 Tax=Pseudomonas sp. Pseu.R1 TaxID=3379818 RepID=UPI003B94C1BA
MPDSTDDLQAIGSADETCFSTTSLNKAYEEEKALEDPTAKVRKEVHALTIHALRFGAALLAALVIVRFWHMAGPPELLGQPTRWLTESELQSMDNKLFSSAFGGLILGCLRETLKPS